MELYGISGNKGHGKDTFARFVREAKEGFLITHFATDLKLTAGRIFGLTEGQMHDPSLKEVPFDTPVPMDDQLDAMRRETGLDIQPQGKVAVSPRELMQFWGTEYVRTVQDDYWTQQVLTRVKGSDRSLVPDTRYPNEAMALRSVGGKIIKVVRIDAPKPKDTHSSETEMEKIVPDLLVGAVTGDLSLPQRVAQLVADNRFAMAQLYDYRRACDVINAYSHGKNVQDCLEDLQEEADFYPLTAVLRYYGVVAPYRNPSGACFG